MLGTFFIFITLIIAIGWHELGHYLAARFCGVKVPMYSLGFGKAVFSCTDKRGTEWRFAPILLGGYVKLDEESLSQASPLKQAVIFLAGPFFNLLLFLLPLVVFHADIVSCLKLIWHAYWGTFGAIGDTAARPFQLLFGHLDRPQLTGIIGAAHESTKMDPGQPILLFIDLWLSLNAGVMIFNLLPIPMLDGGRVVFALIGKFLGGAERAKKTELYATYAGALFLLYLFIVITVTDVTNLFVHP